MHTNFGGRVIVGFGAIATFKNSQFSLYSIDRNQLKKFMQAGIDVTCMHTILGGHVVFRFKDFFILHFFHIDTV